MEIHFQIYFIQEKRTKEKLFYFMFWLKKDNHKLVFSFSVNNEI